MFEQSRSGYLKMTEFQKEISEEQSKEKPDKQKIMELAEKIMVYQAFNPMNQYNNPFFL